MASGVAQFLTEHMVSGWVSPQGDLYPCPYFSHNDEAMRLIAELRLPPPNAWPPDETLVRLGWLRVSRGRLLWSEQYRGSRQAQVDRLLELLEGLWQHSVLSDNQEACFERDVKIAMGSWGYSAESNPSDLQVVYVDGCAVRDQLEVDFTMGGHPARYSFIPSDAIWIDACLGGKDRACTIVHELVELRLMVEQGMSYENAHELANRAERAMRAEVDPEIPATSAEAVAMSWLGLK